MNILHLSKFYPPYQGGIETFLFDLNESLNLNDLGVKSDILAFNEESSSIDECQSGYLIHRSACQISIAKMPISVNYTLWLVKHANKYDIIHLHYPNPFADLSLFLSRFKGKVIIHWHSDVVKQKYLDLLYAPLRKWLMKRANSIIATSPNYLSGSKQLSSHNKKVKVVPLGLDENRIGEINQDSLERLKLKYINKKIIFSLGRQVYYKGFEYLIKSAQYLPDDFVVLIGGKGELYETHKQLVVELGLSEKVELLGFIDSYDLRSYYEVCDIFTMSSIERSEAFGVVQLEAMCLGKPIVSTAIPGSGVGWVNEHNVTGIVVQPKNEKALAEAFISIIGNDKVDYSTNSKLRFETKFTIGKTAEELVKIYKEVLGR